MGKRRHRKVQRVVQFYIQGTIEDGWHGILCGLLARPQGKKQEETIQGKDDESEPVAFTCFDDDENDVDNDNDA